MAIDEFVINPRFVHGPVSSEDDVEKRVEEMGFAGFNRCPHLLIDLPNETFTISARTSTGRLITFSFLPYTDGGTPQCVDIKVHNPHYNQHVDNGGRLLPVQEYIAFACGQNEHSFRHNPKDNGKTHPPAYHGELIRPSLLCILMEDKERE